MKNGVFWDVTPCGSCKNLRFGGTQGLLHQAIGSSETSVLTRATWRNIPKGAILYRDKGSSMWDTPTRTWDRARIKPDQISSFLTVTNVELDDGHIDQNIHSKGFWRWCVTLITTKLLDFVHRPDFYKQKTQHFGNWICFRLQARGGGHLLYRRTKSLPFHGRCQSRVGAPPRLKMETDPVSETLCFLIVEIRTMYKVQKLSSNEIKTYIRRHLEDIFKTVKF
jgi:hypothetical protein